MARSSSKKPFFEMDPAITGVSGSTIQNIIRAWQESGKNPPAIRPDVPDEDVPALIKLMAGCIKEDGGEISKQAKIVALAIIYIHLSVSGKGKFLEILARHFDVNIEVFNNNLQKLKDSKTEEERIVNELQLRDSLMPPWVKLLRQFIALPNGFIFLKDMRADLLSLTKSSPLLKKMSDDLKMLLASYFDVNILDLKEITWNSSAALLERLMEYEAVHEIASWKDLKHRLLTDHRVFAFFHNKMPNEPLIFVEVALVKGISDNIRSLIDVNVKPCDPRKVDTAIFYSICSTQKGLEGISFGSFLIKRVVKKIAAEYNNIRTFATLSPVPFFKNWLTIFLQYGDENIITSEEEKMLCKLAKSLSGYKDGINGGTALLEILKAPEWHENKKAINAVKKPLMRLCAHYLFNVKQGTGFKAYDPVANFHLSNGAKIEHIQWLADSSQKGIRQSAGIMVNYHYRLDKIALNHENYMTNGSIHASSDAKSWLGK